MTTRRVVILTAAAICLILAVTGLYYVLPPAGGSTTVTIVVTAGPKLSPMNFSVIEGQHVTIVFDNADDGPHEFRIGEFSVDTGIVQGGQTASVSFVPNKVGTFIVVQPCPAGPPGTPPPCGIEGYVTVSPK